MNKRILILILPLALLSAVGVVLGGARGGTGGLGGVVGGRGRALGSSDLAANGVTEMPEADRLRAGGQSWPIDPHFKGDVFTFVRVRYQSTLRSDTRYTNVWLTDYPDSDLNFSYRLQQVTSLKVDPKPKQLQLTDPELFDYPFIYMLEVRTLAFSEEEVACLRRYLLNGGFLMVDDFWGIPAWESFHAQMRRVFPDREPTELDISHPIFHCVFDLKFKPQVPGLPAAIRNRGTDITWEREQYGDAKEPHYRSYFDDKGRMMTMICQNTDLGDGWEREGEAEWYFKRFSEAQAYPMGINIVFYAMTH